MDALSSGEITALFLALGLLLATARVLGEVSRKIGFPSVLGEILAGVLWGPTVFGGLFPHGSALLFPMTGSQALVMDGLMTLGVTLFLMVAGLEVDLSTVWRQGKTALQIGVAGILFPFAVGFAAAWFFPRMLGSHLGADPVIFALFMATALSISALPVIAKTLMDLDLYRSDLGVMVIAAAVFNDIVGWIVFAVILGMMGTTHPLTIGQTIGLALGFALIMLTLGRFLIHRSLPWVQAHSTWPAGILAFALTLTLFSAAFTEWIGLHAIFGAFLAGVALGDSSHLRERSRAIIEKFISFIFAPLFFASIGLKVNFAANFDPLLVGTVLVIATIGKVLGCGLAGQAGGLPRNEAWAIGFGMNARGAMEIVLGLLALKYGIIGEKLFVALVVMALVTSLISGPMMQKLLHLKKPRRFTSFMTPKTFMNHIHANSRQEVITLLARAAAGAARLPEALVTEMVLNREALMPTGIGNGLAVPHAQVKDLAAPVVAVGLSREGIDFDAPDETPARIIFLILTPVQDPGAQVEILADIAATFRIREIREKALGVGTYTEFLALIRGGQGQGAPR